MKTVLGGLDLLSAGDPRDGTEQSLLNRLVAVRRKL